jgi:hypothetical protein
MVKQEEIVVEVDTVVVDINSRHMVKDRIKGNMLVIIRYVPFYPPSFPSFLVTASFFPSEREEKRRDEDKRGEERRSCRSLSD